MSRLRYNGLATGSSGSLTALTLGGSLTSSGTTITFSAALTYNNGTAVPTISGSDYIPLSILDSSGNLSEVVYLTAYTAAATTGTITRGQEGTTGVAHASGDKVVSGPTALEFAAANTTSKSANYTAVAGEFVLMDATSGSLTLTMPSSPAAGARVTIKKIDSSGNAVTVSASSPLIEGFAYYTLITQWASLKLIYSGSTWVIEASTGTVAPPGPTLRGSKVTYVNNVSTVNATLPTGTIAGDLLVVAAQHGYAMNNPTGATSIVTGGQPGGAAYKVATSTDITNGYIAVPFANSYYGEAMVQAVIGANATSPIRTSIVNQPTSATNPTTVTTPLNAQAGDLCLYFSGSRQASSSGGTASFSKGTAGNERHADSNVSGATASYTATSTTPDAYTVTWTARDGGVSSIDAIVVVRS